MPASVTCPLSIRRASYSIVTLLASFSLGLSPLLANDSNSEAPVEEKFDAALSKEWFWGLGTWTTKDGVLRGFESGPRRHGPVKMRRFLLKEGTIECEFRLMGKAKFAGIIFNGSQERGHIVHLVVGRDQLRILVHPKKDEVIEMVKEPLVITPGEWHRVRIEFHGDTMVASLDERTFTARHHCLAEEKQAFGLGGDSGGPAGETAGALEFRALRASMATR